MSRSIERTHKHTPASKVAVIMGGCLTFFGTPANASDFNAEKVMKEMKPEQQYAYLSGVIEGLAIARYMKDGKQKDGMGCIYGWFYEDKSTLPAILDAFDKYPTYPPGAIIDVMVKRKCGE